MPLIKMILMSLLKEDEKALGERRKGAHRCERGKKHLTSVAVARYKIF
jgi:hypothetical protein